MRTKTKVSTRNDSQSRAHFIVLEGSMFDLALNEAPFSAYQGKHHSSPSIHCPSSPAFVAISIFLIFLPPISPLRKILRVRVDEGDWPVRLPVQATASYFNIPLVPRLSVSDRALSVWRIRFSIFRASPETV